MNNVGFIRNIFYQMKLDYGVPAVYFVLDKNEYDADTGKMIVKRTAHQIKKLAMLPQNVLRKVIQDIAYLAANKNFTYGAAYDENSTIVLLEEKDIPKGVKLNINNWFVIDNRRYTLSKFEKLAGFAYVVTLHATEGAELFSVHEGKITHTINLQQMTVGEL